MVKNCRFGLLLTALFVIGLSVFSAHAQTPSITLTVGLYHASGNSALRSRLDQFQAAHPGITVTAVDLPALQNELITNPAKHMDDIAHFASSADVLQIVPDLINEADSRAGYFLNIKPLVDQDNTIQASDYYPAAWQSWLWDNAQWGLPVTAEPIVMLYDPVTFDSAGIAYPSANWTADDLAKAIRALSIKNTNGTLSQSAIDLTLPTVLYASLIGSPLFDVNAVPSSPDLAQPGVIPFLTAWQSIHRDGLLDGHDATASPMQITDFHEVIRAAQNNRKLAVALLPGGRAGLLTWGYALSGGTQYPQQAYELARFLADAPEAVLQGDFFPARQTPGKAAITQLPADLRQSAQLALDKAIPTSALRYTEYVDTALDALDSSISDLQVALATAQSRAENDLKIAASVPNAHIAITVATPIPDPTALPGKIVLKFGITGDLLQKNRSNQAVVANRDAWNAVAAEFARTDPEVGKVILDPTGNPIGNNDDCFYWSQRGFSGSGLKYLLNIDPLVETDPTFNPTNFIGTVLDQSKFGNKLWFYPLTIQPGILTYDPKAFASAGVPLPVNGWTINQFADALKQLKAQSGQPAFFLTQGDLPLLMLTAAYGGLPIDYRIDPPALAFSDPTNIDAIRQVLDLAKAGYIGYKKYDDTSTSLYTSSQVHAPIQSDILSANSFQLIMSGQRDYKITTYPTGSQYSTLSYLIGSVALNAVTPYASACYRWIKTLERHPELFNAMPVLRSALNDPNLTNTQSSDLVALYKRIAAQLDNPNTIPFSPQVQIAQGFVEEWLYSAFDNYVLADGDLPSALKQAQDQGVGLNACVATVPPYQAGDAQNLYIKGILACARKIDPTLASNPYFAPLFKSLN